MEQFMQLSSVLVERARAAGELTPEFEAHDIPMLICGVCAAIDKRKAGWDWRRHLELILRGMRTAYCAARAAAERPAVPAALRVSVTG
jgi:hypothetical protein